MKPTVFQANVAPPISAPTRASTTSGSHQGRSGAAVAQHGSTVEYASGSSGSASQSCTGNGDHGWSSARDTGTSCQSKGGVRACSEATVGQHRDGLAGRRDRVQVEVDDQQAGLGSELGQHLAARRDRRAVAHPGRAPRGGSRPTVAGSAWPAASTKVVLSSARARVSSCHWSTLPGPAAQDAATQTTAAPCSASRV